MDQVVEALADQHQDWAEYMNCKGGTPRKRQYDNLYTLTKRFTEEYVGPIRASKAS